jgi:hypothetical protein
MKQQATNPNENIQLNSDDLLTGEDFEQADSVLPPSINTAPPLTNIPDMHKVEGMPSAQRRNTIAQQVDQRVADKILTIEDKIQRDIQDAQQQKYVNMPTSPKEILKNLIAKGEYTEDVKLFGHVWTLRALDQGDTLLALEEIRDSFVTQSGRVMSMMFGSVIYSLEAIDGISIYEWFEDIKLTAFKNNRMEYHIAVRKALRQYLEAMPPTVVDSLYEKYLEVDERRNKAVSELKNS